MKFINFLLYIWFKLRFSFNHRLDFFFEKLIKLLNKIATCFIKTLSIARYNYEEANSISRKIIKPSMLLSLMRSHSSKMTGNLFFITRCDFIHLRVHFKFLHIVAKWKIVCERNIIRSRNSNFSTSSRWMEVFPKGVAIDETWEKRA